MINPDKPLSENVLILRSALENIKPNLSIENELDNDFHYMEGTGNTMSSDTQIVTKAVAYGLITQDEALQLFVDDALKNQDQS